MELMEETTLPITIIWLNPGRIQKKVLSQVNQEMEG